MTSDATAFFIKSFAVGDGDRVVRDGRSLVGSGVGVDRDRGMNSVAAIAERAQADYHHHHAPTSAHETGDQRDGADRHPNHAAFDFSARFGRLVENAPIPTDRKRPVGLDVARRRRHVHVADDQQDE